MSFPGFTDEAVAFYEGLEADNSKTYWTEHKDTYEQLVKKPMRALLEELAPVFAADISLFRPHRDVRFSKDKSPYKTHQGGLLEVAAGVGYYVQLDAEGVLIGGGFHARDREQIARFRAAIDADRTGTELEIITAKLVKTGFIIGGEQVKTRPRGVRRDHPRLDLMRREYITVSTMTAPESVTVAEVKKRWRAITPLLDWVIGNAGPVLD